MNDAIKRMLDRYKSNSDNGSEKLIREILQEITLVGLWRGKFFEHAAFYGGTALRILYGLDRFSEDLDFTLLDKDRPFEWKHFEKTVVEELSSFGFQVTFQEKKKSFETAVQSAFLKTNTMHATMQIGIQANRLRHTHPDATIRIKVEIDSNPALGFSVKEAYLKEPLPIPIRVLDEPSLFAGKTHAALFRAWKQRVKGRDWYDLIWFLRRDIPINLNYTQECMRVSGALKLHENLTLEQVKKLLEKRIQKINLEAAKDDVRSFLRDPRELELWSIPFFLHWISQLRE